jgi:hypothetical protein
VVRTINILFSLFPTQLWLQRNSLKSRWLCSCCGRK